MEGRLMPAKFKKLVQNGAAAILYAQGPGNGWSSSNPKYEGLIYDRDIVRAVLAGDRTRVMTIAKTKYPSACVFGGASLQVAWVPEGAHFRIEGAGGSERVVILNSEFGNVA
jgi:hypothetical protein